jgi:hypothetical protein
MAPTNDELRSLRDDLLAACSYCSNGNAQACAVILKDCINAVEDHLPEET